MNFLTYNPSPLPANAVILNYCLCAICHQPYLCDSSGSPICGRQSCYLMQLSKHPRAITAIAGQSQWWNKAKEWEKKEKERKEMIYASTTDLMKNKTHGRGRQRRDMTEIPSRKLTLKEQQVVNLTTQGLSCRQTAQVMGTSEQVIKNYRKNIIAFYGVETMLQVVIKVLNEQKIQELTQ